MGSGLLLRVVAKGLDLILMAAMAEVLPRAGYLAALAYVLVADGLWGGRSLGKRLLGLRVVRLDGSAAGVRESILRNGPLALGVLLWKLPLLGWLLAAAVFALETLLMVGSPEGRRLGDELAGTEVLKEEQTQERQEA
jgi:uncharacterized RDD family membrane protein YckC